MVVRPIRRLAGSRYPDLLVAFGVDPALYKASNGYIIDDPGKPPDFVLEIASPHTGQIAVGAKRDDYAALAIPEYWRFDETGEFHGTRLAGDRLIAGEYEPIPVDELEQGMLQGYSETLNLHLRWEHGQLRSQDPKTDRQIATFEDERAARVQAEARVHEFEPNYAGCAAGDLPSSALNSVHISCVPSFTGTRHCERSVAISLPVATSLPRRDRGVDPLLTMPNWRT